LNPSPEQRLRIRLALGKKLIAQDLPRQAMKNYQALLSETPGYPGKNFVEDKIQSLEQKLNTARQP
jgi:hypothetical protein